MHYLKTLVLTFLQDAAIAMEAGNDPEWSQVYRECLQGNGASFAVTNLGFTGDYGAQPENMRRLNAEFQAAVTAYNASNFGIKSSGFAGYVWLCRLLLSTTAKVNLSDIKYLQTLGNPGPFPEAADDQS